MLPVSYPSLLCHYRPNWLIQICLLVKILAEKESSCAKWKLLLWLLLILFGIRFRLILLYKWKNSTLTHTEGGLCPWPLLGASCHDLWWSFNTFVNVDILEVWEIRLRLLIMCHGQSLRQVFFLTISQYNTLAHSFDRRNRISHFWLVSGRTPRRLHLYNFFQHSRINMHQVRRMMLMYNTINLRCCHISSRSTTNNNWRRIKSVKTVIIHIYI